MGTRSRAELLVVVALVSVVALTAAQVVLWLLEPGPAPLRTGGVSLVALLWAQLVVARARRRDRAVSTGDVGALGVLGLFAVGVATLGWPAGDWLDRTLVVVNVAMAVTAVAFGVMTWRNGRPAATRREPPGAATAG